MCETCDSGYVKISNGESCASDSVGDAVTATSATMAAGFAASMASPQGGWSMVNQFQILMLMPLTDAYMPPDIILFLTGLDFTMFTLGFMNISKIPGIKYFFNLFDFTQSDSYFSGNFLGLNFFRYGN